jgi:hypothetical protein
LLALPLAAAVAAATAAGSAALVSQATAAELTSGSGLPISDETVHLKWKAYVGREPLAAGVKPTRGLLRKRGRRACGADDDKSRYPRVSLLVP